MKNNLLKSTAYFISIVVCLMGFSQALATRAYRQPVNVQQSDLSILTLRMMGDEKIKWAETTDQYSLLRNAGGYWEYAILDINDDMVPSGELAHSPEDRTPEEVAFLSTIPKSLTYSDSQITAMLAVWNAKNSKGTSVLNPIGNKKLLMILVEFQDVSFTKTQTDFDNLMNQLNYNLGTAVGSVKDYYYENSYQQFTLSTTVVGPVKVSQNMSYYGANHTSTGYDLRPDSMVSEAVRLANPMVNYAQFDNDNDGTLDGLYVIYAGYGEEAGASANAIWAHAWAIPTLTPDGINVNSYSCSSELRDNTGSTLTSIGIICHEFGHLCGAPDYYDTDYSQNGQYDGSGYWDVMADGNWNNNGDMPAHHNPYTKSVSYGWITPTVISGASDIILRDVSQFGDVIRINTTTSNEYFLMENRQISGFNATCPGHGLLVYHVDHNHIATYFSSNSINAGGHQGLFPMAANSLSSNGVNASSNSTINTSDCPFPGTSNNPSFSDNSWPHSKSWAGNNTGYPSIGIAESGGAVTFCVTNCDASKPGSFTATATGQTQINLAWTQNTSNDPVMVAFNTVNSFGTPTNGTPYTQGQTLAGGGTVLVNGSGLSYNHTGLSHSTTYYYKAWSVATGNIYSSGRLANATTQCGNPAIPFHEPFLGNTLPACWSLVDHAGTNCDWEFGTISGYGSSDPALNGNYAYLHSNGYGNKTVNADLISPTFDFTEYVQVNLEFKFYFRQWSSSTGTVYYSLNNGASWNFLVQFLTTSSTNPSVFNLFIPSATGQSAVKFKWNYSGTWEYYWAIDDVKVTAVYGPTWTGSLDNDWHKGGNWAGGAVPGASKNVVIPFTPVNPVITQSTVTPATCNDLTIEANAKVTVDPGNFLTVFGTLTNHSGTTGLLLRSDASNTASLIHSTTGVSGTFDRYMNDADWSNWKDGWHFLSSPVPDHPVSPNFTSAPYDFYCWHEPGDVWVNYKNTTVEPTWVTANGSSNFNSGKGYMAAYDNAQTLLFQGNFQTSDVNLSGLTLTNASNPHSFHLLGNPFCSSLLWDGSSAWNLVGIGGVAKIWNESGQSYSDLTSSPPSYIPPTNGFMIQVNNASASLTLPSANRVHSSTAFYKNNLPQLLLRAVCPAEGNFQETRILIHPEATDSYDPMLEGAFTKGYAPELYSFAEDRKLSTQALGQVSENTRLFLGFHTNGNQGDFRLDFEGASSFPSKLYLRDLLTNTLVDMTKTNSYSFQAGQDDPPQRFVLSFGSTGLSDTEGAEVFLYQNKLYTVPVTGPVRIDVYSLTGQKVLSVLTSQSPVPIQLKRSLYLIRVEMPGKTVCLKAWIY